MVMISKLKNDSYLINFQQIDEYKLFDKDLTVYS